ncbi:sigma-70 family RNA polymerase sigma factor, partial [Candidatus Dojkabacteria bacterium]|nr:sigma-70 family RNA polymerase sigma factor [Candidatus Dojkabacteria bacterium]
TSETFLAFAERIRSGKSIESPSKFIMGIAYNKLQAYLRERYRIPRGEYDLEKISDDSDDLDEVLTEGKKITTLEEILLEFLDELPGQQKQIIKLRLIDKLSLPEICERIDKNMGYVKTTQNRAIKNLQKLVACKPVDTN